MESSPSKLYPSRRSLMSTPFAPYGPPPPKKTSFSGCFIAVAVVLGLFLVGFLVAGLLVWDFFLSPTGKKIAGAAHKTGTLVSEAATGPGTAPMHALGCTQPLVIDTEKMIDLVEDLFPDGGTVTRSGAPMRVLLLCQIPRRGPPACDDVVRAYLSAVGTAPGPILATVTVNGAKRSECTESYLADGTKIVP